MAKVIRAAVIGGGSFGRRHAAVLRAHPRCQLVGIVDADPRVRDSLAGEFGPETAERGSAGEQSRIVAELSALGDVDAVIIATPDTAHLRPGLAAIAAGMHVLLEKPITTSLSEARALERAASESTSVLAVGHLLRFDPRMHWIREHLTEGRWGRAVHGTFHRDGAAGLQEVYPSVSPMLQGGIHDIDLVAWLFDSRIVSVRCTGVNSSAGNPIQMALLAELANGSTAVIQASRLLPVPMPADPHTVMWIGAARETVSVEDLGSPILGSARAASTVPSSAVPTAMGVNDLLALQLDAFIAGIDGDPSPSTASFADGRRALSVALAAEQSMVLGGERIAVEHE